MAACPGKPSVSKNRSSCSSPNARILMRCHLQQNTGEGSLRVWEKERCGWNILSLGEVMLRFDSGASFKHVLRCVRRWRRLQRGARSQPLFWSSAAVLTPQLDGKIERPLASYTVTTYVWWRRRSRTRAGIESTQIADFRYSQNSTKCIECQNNCTNLVQNCDLPPHHSWPKPRPPPSDPSQPWQWIFSNRNAMDAVSGTEKITCEPRTF
jgi:hypothetical protein